MYLIKFLLLMIILCHGKMYFHDLGHDSCIQVYLDRIELNIFNYLC